MSFPPRVHGTVLRYASDRCGCSGFAPWGSGPHLFGMDIERTAAGNPWGLEPLLDVKELAAYLHVPVSTVYDWRTRGFGPRAYRFGKSEACCLRRPGLDRAARPGRLSATAVTR